MEDLQGGTLALEHRYDLDRRVGDYALFTVYQGTQHPFDRSVWIKVCEAPAEFSAAPLYQRIKRAAVEGSQLEHERIAEVVDFGDIDKHVPFVVSRRVVDGVSLEDYLESHGTLPPAEALEITRRVAETLQEAHDQGHVHGGLAPGWVTVADEGVYLDHFGFQPTMAEIRGLDGVMMSSDLLWSLPPEQFGDEPIEPDVVGDVWALGALLYWMLSGVHPYFDDPADTGDAILRLRNSSAPRSLDELGVEAEVSTFVDRALHPDPDERFGAVSKLLAEGPWGEPVEESPNASPSASPSAVPPARSVSDETDAGRPGTVLALLLVLLVLTNVGWLFYTTSSDTEDSPGVRSLPPAEPAVLPVGVQLKTEPPGGKVFRLDGDEVIEFGDTPMVLDPKAATDGELPLLVRLPGHRDVRLVVKPAEDGHDLVVHLPPEDDDAVDGARDGE